MSREALFTCRLVARTGKSWFVTHNHLDIHRVYRTSVAEMSAQTSMCAHGNGVFASSTSQLSTSVAISRSELVMLLSGFLSVTR